MSAIVQYAALGQRSLRAPSSTLSRDPESDRQAMDSGYARALLRLQRLVGNHVVAELIGSNHPQATVQRCGGAVHAGCACAQESPANDAERAKPGR